MDVNEAIHTRRTIAKYLPKPIPVETLRRIIEAGIWAPNHHLTEPWSFIVLGPATRHQLAERFGELHAIKANVESPERRERIREENTRRFLDIPAVVAVVVNQTGDDRRRREDYAAACCAIQNIQLAAWSEGIGVKWSTHGVTRDTLTFELLRLDPEGQIIAGFMFVGYPAETPVRVRKRTLDDVLCWSP